MSLAWYVVLEREVAGFDPSVNGKFIAKAGDQLDAIAKSAGVTPLMDFFSASPEMLEGLMEDAGEDTFVGAPSEQWFSAEDGLKTVRVLLEATSNGTLPSSDKIASDLREFETVLEKALSHGVRWHLAIDF